MSTNWNTMSLDFYCLPDTVFTNANVSHLCKLPPSTICMAFPWA